MTKRERQLADYVREQQQNSIMPKRKTKRDQQLADYVREHSLERKTHERRT